MQDTSNAPASTVAVTSIALERDSRNFQIAASLARLGYDASVVEAEESRIDRCVLPFRLITIDGARAQPGAGVEAGGGEARTPNPLLRPLLTGGSFARENLRTAQALPPADLYYLTYWWQAPAVLRAARRHDAAIVYDANDAYWAWPGYQSNAAGLRAAFKHYETAVIKKAGGFITVSEGVAGMLEERYGRRPEVVRNVHDLRVDEPSPVRVRDASGLGEDAFLVVIAGNEKPSDSVEAPIRALGELPGSVHLALMGRGYESHRTLIDELGLGARVHLLPPVPPAQVTEAIRSADLALINTRATDIHLHALPTRLFSAVSAGLPVTYPPLPEVAAICEQHALGLPADAEDVQAIAAAIRSLAAQPERLAEFAANAERASATLNWEQEEKLLQEIVEQALHPDRG